MPVTIAHRPLRSLAHRSQGGTFAGLLAGILIGLGTALAVAIFVTKAPVPFLNKTARAPERALDPKTPETAPDPNKPLFSRSRADPSAQAAPESSVGLPGLDRNAQAAPEPASPEPLAERREAERSVTEARTPAPIEPARPSTPQAMPQGGGASMPPAVTQAPNPVAPAPARAAAPAQGAAVAPPAAAAAPAPGAGGEGYVLQAGAFRTVDDAEAMRGRLALLGFEARVISSEVNGLAVQRVRIGPFTRMEDMNRARTKLTESGIEVSVVRVR